MPGRPLVSKKYKDDEAKIKAYSTRLGSADAKYDEDKDSIHSMFERYALEPRDGEFTDSGQRVTVTNGLSNIDALFASLTAVDIEFVVRNLAHGTPDQARLAAAGLNEAWTETRASEESADAIKDGIIGGIGFIKVGYEYAEQERTIGRSDEEIAVDVDEIINAAAQVRSKPPTPDEIADLVPATKQITEAVRDRIVVDYLDWEDVRFDPGAKRWKDIRWVAHYTKVPEHEVKNDPEYRKYVQRHRGGLQMLEDLKADAVLSKKSLGTQGSDKLPDKDDDRITVVTFFDFETGTACIFPKGKRFVLNEVPNPFDINDDNQDKSPIVPIVFRKDPRRIRGISEMRVQWSALDELELYRSKRAQYLARFVPKLAAEQGAMTEAGKAAFQSSDYGAVVETEQGRPPSASLMPLAPPPLPAEIFQVEERLLQDMKDSTGISEPMLGIFSEGRHSATEAQQVAQSSTSRHSEKRNRLERFFIDVARRILMLMQMNYDKARVSRLVGDEGDIVWEWDAESITMEADLQIHLSPKEVVTKQTKRDNALATANVAGAAGPAIDQAELWSYVFEEMGIPRDVIARLMKTPAEVQEEALAAAQQEQQMAGAAEGMPVDPAATPGPLPAEDLAAAVNSGELPEDQAAILGLSPGVGP